MDLFPDKSVTQEAYPGLPNLLQIADKLFSGGEPQGEIAMDNLARLGVKTIVSVDGAVPPVELAAKHGLSYVHVPMGYDGIAASAGLSLIRLAREREGSVYIHCHHGRHRGPAAAAVFCIAAGIVDADDAVEILKRSGTSPHYVGLWRDVAAFSPPDLGDDEVDWPELVAVAKVGGLTEAMADLDRIFDLLQECQRVAWNSPTGHPDVAAAQQALLLRERLREIARVSHGDRDERFLAWLQACEGKAASLECQLRADPVGRLEADRILQDLRQDCVRCHEVYRDKPTAGQQIPPWPLRKQKP